MKMPGNKRRLDICPAQFATHEPRSRIFPDCVFDVHDRCHQGDETKISFNYGEQRPDPTAVARAEQTELVAVALT